MKAGFVRLDLKNYINKNEKFEVMSLDQKS